MMKRLGRISAAVALVTGLSVGAARAQAQLGFTIDPISGLRGTTVNGQVNPADVAANCVTDQGAFQARFTDLLNGPFVAGNFEGELPQTWFPDPNNIVYENTNQMAYALTLLLISGISQDTGAAAAALPQTFVMTFTEFDQTPIGEPGHFDPVTGVGSVVVPDIAPAIWPVVAECVGPVFDLDILRAGIEASGAFLTGIGAQFGPAGPSSPEFLQFMRDFLGPNAPADDSEVLPAFVNAIGPKLLQAIVTPDALGVQLFTITTSPLAFTIDPTAGRPGDTVNGQVNPADIAAHCVTELDAFRAQFALLFAVPFAGGAPEGELFGRFFPGGTFDVFENYDQLAYSHTGLTAFGIAGDFNGAAQTALPQTFVMTFADISTQQPLGPVGHFDPVTGVGSVTVPNLNPGVYPVAATCVRVTLNVDQIEAGLRRSGAFLQSIGMPLAQPGSPEWEAFVQTFLGSSQTGIDLIFEFLNAVGPTLIQNIVIPGGLGLQFFSVLADVDHFQCYRARTTGFTGGPITLQDRFGSRAATVKSPIDLCAPANKNNEDPEAADSPGFLTSYKISTSGSFQQLTGVAASNQFGDVTLNVKKPKVLLVPTAVSLTGPPSPDGAFLNHFNCYDVRVTNGTKPPPAGTVTVQTAFEMVQVQPKKPVRLCVPTSKNNGVVIPSQPENLLCYRSKSKGGLNPAPTVFLANQFGQQTQRLGQRRELCVPTNLFMPI